MFLSLLASPLSLAFTPTIQIVELQQALQTQHAALAAMTSCHEKEVLGLVDKAESLQSELLDTEDAHHKEVSPPSVGKEKR